MFFKNDNYACCFTISYRFEKTLYKTISEINKSMAQMIEPSNPNRPPVYKLEPESVCIKTDWSLYPLTSYPNTGP